MLCQWKQIHKKNKESFEAEVQKQRQQYVAAAVAILVAWPYSTCGGRGHFVLLRFFIHVMFHRV